MRRALLQLSVLAVTIGLPVLLVGCHAVVLPDLQNGRAEWILEGGTDHAYRGVEVLKSGRVVNRRMTGLIEYDYATAGEWAVVSAPREGLAYLTLPVSRFQDSLSSSTGKQGILERQDTLWQRMGRSKEWKLVGRGRLGGEGTADWLIARSTSETYVKVGGSEQKPFSIALPEQNRSESPVVQCTVWLLPGTPRIPIASAMLRADLASSASGLLKWTSSPPDELPGIAQPHQARSKMCLVVFSSLDVRFNRGIRHESGALAWHLYRPGKLLSEKENMNDIAELSRRSAPLPLEAPVLDVEALRQIGIERIYVPKSLPPNWRLLDATVSGSDQSGRTGYLWHGSSSFVCTTLGVDQEPGMTALLLQKPANAGDDPTWTTKIEMVGGADLAIKLSARTRTIGGTLVVLVGHNIADTTLSALQESLVPLSVPPASV